jgi:hypothetical protein
MALTKKEQEQEQAELKELSVLLSSAAAMSVKDLFAHILGNASMRLLNAITAELEPTPAAIAVALSVAVYESPDLEVSLSDEEIYHRAQRVQVITAIEKLRREGTVEVFDFPPALTDPDARFSFRMTEKGIAARLGRTNLSRQ